jgi:hypothetical protein
MFSRLFELVIEKDILKLNDGNYYEVDYGCCTFNTQRKNSFQHITHIQLAPCGKDEFAKRLTILLVLPKS